MSENLDSAAGGLAGPESPAISSTKRGRQNKAGTKPPVASGKLARITQHTERLHADASAPSVRGHTSDAGESLPIDAPPAVEVPGEEPAAEITSGYRELLASLDDKTASRLEAKVQEGIDASLSREDAEAAAYAWWMAPTDLSEIAYSENPFPAEIDVEKIFAPNPLDTLEKRLAEKGKEAAFEPATLAAIREALDDDAVNALKMRERLKGLKIYTDIKEQITADKKKERQAEKDREKEKDRLAQEARDAQKLKEKEEREAAQLAEVEAAALAAAEKEEADKAVKEARAQIPESGHFESEGKVYYLNKLSDVELISNIAPRIIKETIIDDEAEQHRHFVISGKIAGDNRIREGTIKAEDFRKSSWIANIFGAGAAVQPRKIEHLWAFVNEISVDREESWVIAHMGWRNDGDGYKYVHAGGAIDATGLIKVETEIGSELSFYELETPFAGDDLKKGWDLFTDRLFKSATSEISSTLGGSVLVPLVAWPDFSTFSVGTTGKGKSTYTYLWLSLFGRRFVEAKPPVEWQDSTAFGLQLIAHKAKNTPLFIDEFVPKASKDPQKLQYVATAHLRSQANHSGRTAGKTDATLRAHRVPRGGTISAGEDLPPGPSIRARCVILEFTESLTDAIKAQLTPLQKDARDGVIVGLGAAFIQWLATDNRIETILAKCSDDVANLRVKWNERLTHASVHPRTASNFAHLERAWNLFYQFGVEKKLITEDDKKVAMEIIIAGLLTCAEKQAQWLADGDPAKRFIGLIAVALGSGKAHIELKDGEIDGKKYKQNRALGWRLHDGKWEPRGECIGWYDGDYGDLMEGHFYIQPEAARKVVDAYAANGEGIALTQKRLNTKLSEDGYLALTDTARNTVIVRRLCQGATRKVLALKGSTIFSALDDQESEPEEVEL